jgi:hypothetical protein
MRRSVTSLPLHHGRAPGWLFERMRQLSAAVASLIVLEFGPGEFVRRMADPVWFQALGCLVGFDWHSSGLTTTLCGALKEGLARSGGDLPVAICGGKGRAALRTPQELARLAERWAVDAGEFVTMSRLCAKVDNSLVQDGYDLYHHVFICSRDGDWAVVQQGMNGEERTARRYQWLSRDDLDVTCEPHTGITCDRTEIGLNLIAKESGPTRSATIAFTREDPDKMNEVWKDVCLSMPKRHYITPGDVDGKRLGKVFRVLHESRPATYRDLLQVGGVGPRTLAALALVSEIVYDAPPSFQDPARFSFAHGGKDGHPFPVDRKTYDRSIEFLKECLDGAKVNDREKIDAFKRLAQYEARVKGMRAGAHG